MLLTTAMSFALMLKIDLLHLKFCFLLTYEVFESSDPIIPCKWLRLLLNEAP